MYYISQVKNVKLGEKNKKDCRQEIDINFSDYHNRS